MKIIALFFTLSFLLSLYVVVEVKAGKLIDAAPLPLSAKNSFLLKGYVPNINVCTNDFSDVEILELKMATNVWKNVVIVNFSIDNPQQNCDYLMSFVNNRFLEKDNIAETWLDFSGTRPLWITWYSRMWSNSHKPSKLKLIMIHEIGHMLGLDDLMENVKDIMFAVQNDQKTYLISSYDLHHISKTYLVKTFKPYVIQ